LSSGVTGTMVANRVGLKYETVRNIALAWVLTFPTTTLLGGLLFVVFRFVVQGWFRKRLSSLDLDQGWSEKFAVCVKIERKPCTADTFTGMAAIQEPVVHYEPLPFARLHDHFGRLRYAPITTKEHDLGKSLFNPQVRLIWLQLVLWQTGYSIDIDHCGVSVHEKPSFIFVRSERIMHISEIHTAHFDEVRQISCILGGSRKRYGLGGRSSLAHGIDKAFPEIGGPLSRALLLNTPNRFRRGVPFGVLADDGGLGSNQYGESNYHEQAQDAPNCSRLAFHLYSPTRGWLHAQLYVPDDSANSKEKPWSLTMIIMKRPAMLSINAL
jgi:hypothetical protein